MDLNRIRQLAGMLAESSDSSGKKAEIVYSKPGVGQHGSIIVIFDDAPGVGMLAAMLDIPKGWKLTKVGKVWAAYNASDRLTFFSTKDDFDPDMFDTEEN